MTSSVPGSFGGARTGQLEPRPDSLFGTVLADRYRVLDVIGKGGMGKVYLAEHVAIGKRVAIKVLSQAYCHRPDQVKRFLREARAASTIDHPNVIDTSDFGEMDNGSVFFVMEYLQGTDLGKTIRKRGPLPWGRARRIFIQICRALQAAHDRGVIHRDMKPENVFLNDKEGVTDFVKVLDFGIAKVVDEERQNQHTLTQAGALIGTPEYMSPEQVRGEAADRRMDIYSVGCIMYQVLTGKLPFKDSNMFGVLNQQVNAPPKPLREITPEADIPPEAEALVLKCMEKHASNRFQTMADIVEAIEAVPWATPYSEDEMMFSTPGGPMPPIDASNSGERAPWTENHGPDSVTDRLMVNSEGGLTATLGGQSRMMVHITAALAILVLILGGTLIYVIAGRDDPKDEAEVAEVEPPEPTKIIAAAPVEGSEPPKPDAEGTTAAAQPDEVVVDPSAGEPDEVEEPAPEERDTPRKKSTPKPKSEPKPKAEPKPSGPLPKDLDLRARKKVQDGIQRKIDKCGSGGKVKIDVTVQGSTGKVTAATPVAQPSADVGDCVVKAVKKARFPRFRDASQTFTLYFKL
ncbi:MAG: protein kinase [Myxococcales bacterium]|nr:protein kinase [Myxococcales bacterium]